MQTHVPTLADVKSPHHLLSALCREGSLGHPHVTASLSKGRSVPAEHRRTRGSSLVTGVALWARNLSRLSPQRELEIIHPQVVGIARSIPIHLDMNAETVGPCRGS